MATILLVEDDPDVGPLMLHVLFGAGHRVHATSSAVEALRLLDAVTYDLVVADGRLPDGNGIMIADAAAAHGTKALIITAYALQFPAADLERHPYLLKPVRPAELLLSIARLLGEIGPEPAA